MGASTWAALVGMSMFATLVMVVVGIFLAALVLSVAFRLVVGHMPSYLRAVAAVVLSWVAALLAFLVLGSIGPGSIVMFLVGAAVINYLLHTETGLSIGYGKACLVQLIYTVAGVVLALVFGLVMALVVGGMFAGWH